MNTQTMSLQTSLQLFAQVNPTDFQELDNHAAGYLNGTKNVIRKRLGGKP